MIERYRRWTVLWLFEEVQASFTEIAEMMNISLEEVRRLYNAAKLEREHVE